jgi:DNA-binding beta-propeller fold protein YncE
MNRNMVSTITGTRASGQQRIAQFNEPAGVAVDGDGNVIVADLGNDRICKVTPQGQVTTLAGTDKGGHPDEEGTIAQFNWPCGVTVDGGGNVIVADTINHRIRKITPQGQVSTLAGTGGVGFRDGEGTIAQFCHPWGVAVDEGGNVIVADTANNRICKITPQGQVSTLAGNGKMGH